MVAACGTALSEQQQAIVIEEELIAELDKARQLAQRFNLDFQEILDNTLRTFPPDSVNAICVKLNLPRPD